MLELEGEYQIHLDNFAKKGRIRNNILGSIMLVGSIMVAIYIKCFHDQQDGAAVMWFGFFICLIILSIIAIYQSYFPGKDKPIRITVDGIVDQDGNLYPWDEIEHTYLKYEAKAWKLLIYNKESINKEDYKDIPLDKYYVCEREVIDAIEHFSVRDIGEYEDYLRDEFIQRQIKEGKLTDVEISKMSEKMTLYIPYFFELKKEFGKWWTYLSPIFFIVLAISLYLFNTNFKLLVLLQIFFIFMGGLFIENVFLRFIWSYKLEKLKNSKEIKKLTENELDQLLIISNLKIKKSDTIIVCIVSLIWLVLYGYLSLFKFGILS